MSANWLYESDKPDDLLREVILLESNWQDEFFIDDIELQLAELTAHLSASIDKSEPVQEQLYQAVDCLIDELAITGPGLQDLPESSLANLSFCIMHRTGNEMTLAVLFRYLLRQLGFNALIAELEEGMALVIRLSSSELIILDALSGATEYLISNDDVKNSLVSDIAAYAKEIPHDELVKTLISDQKLALLDEGMFEEALTCVETLMDLLPEDPYERRDRGLVLNQLDCGKWAKDDFDYFIKACPNDPMAMFIRLQLEEQNHIVETIH
jgi:regulator of sirC expression with transglutaminase-like and TPR domain